MASMGGNLIDAEPLIQFVRSGGIINKTLAQICQAEGQSKTGVKSDLQNRIIASLLQHQLVVNTPGAGYLWLTALNTGIREYKNNGDKAKFERLKRIIYHHQEIPNAPWSAMPGTPSAPRNAPPPAPGPYFGAPSGHNAYNMGGGANGHRPYSYQKSQLDFKPSPFFKLEQQLGEITPCDKMENHRHTVKINLRAMDHPILAQLQNDTSLKVMVFCAAEEKGLQDIAFPHQSEIKVNSDEIKANLRGLKNKPGSTRPVDITNKLRLKLPAYSNTIEMTYALTLKAGDDLPQCSPVYQKFYLVLYVVKAIPVTDLLQEQGPTWLCPICNNPAPFEKLVVDEYVRNILRNVSRSVDQVTIQPDGKWDLHEKKETNSGVKGVASDDDEDLVEVTKSGNSVRMGTPQTYRTPVGNQLQRSVSSSSGHLRDSSSTSGKRPIAAVIDLTSSGDEDEEPLSRAPKRQQTNGYGASSAVPVYRPAPTNGYTPR
ncbi:hypothetical protein G7Y89_g3509 [Cudoniella acicularis]|uniref:PINIT domain-containing protein n=1 Tax=Cudoniella acicularis TaxID=354080 RepID=A0A8H4RSJ8_9HELO|nr:hypothetical protein G7Y89_g3509 [Cudoniella acicularis]